MRPEDVPEALRDMTLRSRIKEQAADLVAETLQENPDCGAVVLWTDGPRCFIEPASWLPPGRVEIWKPGADKPWSTWNLHEG
jgi:hypothetical protein